MASGMVSTSRYSVHGFGGVGGLLGLGIRETVSGSL